MTRYLFLIMTLGGIILASLFGCTKTSSSSKVKIGFILDNMNEERYAKDKAYFIETAEALGAEVLFASANSDVAIQMSKVENMLSSGVKSIVIQPVDSNASSAMVNAARNDKVPVIAYDRIIYGAPIDLYVTQNSFEVGRLQALAAVEATQGKGNFVILSGAQGHSVAETITSGVKSVLANYPNIKIVAHQYHTGWSSHLALNTVENTLARFNNKIDAILANNSGMAQGAVQAVAEQGLSSKVFIAGADADLTAIKNIVSKKQDFEVLKAIRPLAETAAKAAVAFAKGAGSDLVFDEEMDNKSSQKVKVINTPVYGITETNIQERIIKTGFHDRKAVYGN